MSHLVGHRKTPSRIFFITFTTAIVAFCSADSGMAELLLANGRSQDVLKTRFSSKC